MKANRVVGQTRCAGVGVFLAVLLVHSGVALRAVTGEAETAARVSAARVALPAGDRTSAARESWAVLKERKLADFADLARAAGTDQERLWVREAERTFKGLATAYEEQIAARPERATPVTPGAMALDETRLQAYLTSIQADSVADGDRTFDGAPAPASRAPSGQEWLGLLIAMGVVTFIAVDTKRKPPAGD